MPKRAESVPELEKEREDQLHADEGGEEQRHSDDAGGESRFVKKPGLDEGRLAATHPRPLLPGKKQDAGAGSGKARPGPRRSEERRVGNEWVSTCRSRWSRYQ